MLKSFQVHPAMSQEELNGFFFSLNAAEYSSILSWHNTWLLADSFSISELPAGHFRMDRENKIKMKNIKVVN